MLQVVLIDALGLPDLVSGLEQLVTAKGKPLKVGLLACDADLADIKTYESAIRQLGGRASLGDCLLIVGSAERARTAEGVKRLAVLQVDDAAQLSLLVAARIGGDAVANLEPALRAYLQSRRDLDLTAIESSTPERITFRATAWRPVEGDELGDASGVRAPFPVEGVVTRGADGRVDALKISEPSGDDLQAARSFVASLVHHGQLQSHTPGQRARGTHQIEVDAQGHRRLVRLRTGYR